MSITLHLMTQRDQPYGGERRCCERCGLMMVNRPGSFWRDHAWVDEPDHFKHWPAGEANVPDEHIPCDAKAGAAPGRAVGVDRGAHG